jgi:hypothetical protein
MPPPAWCPSAGAPIKPSVVEHWPDPALWNGVAMEREDGAQPSSSLLVLLLLVPGLGAVEVKLCELPQGLRLGCARRFGGSGDLARCFAGSARAGRPGPWAGLF